MTPQPASTPSYDQRIRRAEELAVRQSFAAEALNFYRQIAVFQQDLYLHLPLEWGEESVAPASGDLRSELNLAMLLPSYPGFLTLVERHAPRPLAAMANLLSQRGSGAWTNLLTDYWTSGGRSDEHSISRAEDGRDPLEEFLARGFLQPYAEFVSAHVPEPASESTRYICPKCDSLPLLSVLRPGDSGKRFLRCAFCAYEWEFRQNRCPACGEERENKLPVFVTEQFPHIRVEPCETCRHYVRTIDLTKNENAVPEVDDLAAIPLTLWAQDKGYARIHPNLLGT